jgi:hypothetical protein
MVIERLNKSVAKHRILFLLNSLCIAITTMMLYISTPTPTVANNMVFTDTGALPVAFVGEDYSAKILVEGGIPPCQFYISAGQLPAGLHLGSDGIIIGKPQSGANSLDYYFTIRVVDNSHYYIEKQFSVMLLYKASIYISNYLNGGETTVIIDDNTKIKARGYQTIWTAPLWVDR